MIKNHEIFLSDPMSFNDPFDCKSNFFLFGDYTKWYNLYKNTGRSHIVADLSAKEYQNKNIEVDEAKRIEFENSHRICCFSKVNDSILMWSHYAKNHQGVCLIYNTSPYTHESIRSMKVEENQLNFEEQHFRENLILLPVKYRYKFPKAFNYFLVDEDPFGVAKYFYTKHKNWHYEKEYRIIVRDSHLKNNSNLISLNKHALKGIIFGLRTSKEYIDEIQNLCLNEYIKLGYSFNLFKAVADKNKYQINIEKVHFN
ncbi:DUF2971 domain-containing protein [Leptospira adleri]|nr:DUF2971 domain-containing protein [Leptospira adleri]